MKRLFTSLIAASMLITALTGCGANSAPASSDTGSSSSAEKVLQIGLSMSSRDQFLSTLETAVVDAAGSDVKLQTFDAENDVQKQISHVQSCASQKFDAMIINLVNTDDAETLVKEAGDMPVVFVNRMPPENVLKKGKVVYVGSDEYTAGQLQGEFLTNLFKSQSKSEVNYVMFMGTLGLQHTTARTDAAKETLAKSFKVVDAFTDTAEFDRVKAMEKMQQFLGTGKPFDCVIANNDEMALGAYEAMKAAGKLGAPIVGIDATENALLAVEDGSMACTVFQDAKGQGSGAFDAAVKLAKGTDCESITYVPFRLVTKENIAEFKK